MRLVRLVAAAVTTVGLLAGSGMRAAETVTASTGDTAKPKPVPAPLAAPIANPWRSATLKAEHGILAGLVGKAATEMQVATGPYAGMRDSTGTAEAKSLMGGLFVQVTQTGTRMREPFERVIIYGFDPLIGKYTAEVMDSTSPAVVRYIGTYDAAKKQLNMTAKYSEQGSRRYVTARLVTTFVDAKTWTYEEFLTREQDKPEAQLSFVQLKRG